MLNKFVSFFSLLIFFLSLRNDWSLTSILLGSIFSLIIILIKIKIFSNNQDKSLSYYKLILYFFWLIREIFLSSFRIAKSIILRKMSISPGYEEIEHGLTDDTSTVIYAMSITLTPGTYVVKSGDRLLIHSLWKNEIKALTKGNKMQQKIENL